MEQAEKNYRQLLDLENDRSDAINLGALLRSQGRYLEAEAHYHQWLSIFSNDRALRLNAANCMRAMGSWGKAKKIIETQLKHEPDHPELLQSLADTALASGNLKECTEVINRLIRKDKNILEAWLTLGICEAKQGHLEKSLQAFETAQKINPEDFRITANIITILKDLGRFELCEKIINELPENGHKNFDVKTAKAVLFMAQGEMEEASILLSSITKDEPEKAMNWLNWSACLKALKYSIAPLTLLKKSLLWNPRNADLRLALGQALVDLGLLQQTKNLWTLNELENIKIIENDVQVFNKQFIGMSTGLVELDELQQASRQWEKKKIKEGVGELWQDHIFEPLQARRLRVGYLSADFCNHPVSKFMIPILENHNHNCFEVFGINAGPHKDLMTERVKASFDQWVDIQFISDFQAARVIADLRLDLIIELGGFTGNNRLGCLVHKPSPIQLSYLGYPAPTYLKCIDGWIGDECLFGDLEIIDKNAHQLINILGGYMCFSPGDNLPIKERSFTSKVRFGSFNHARKLSDLTIKLFTEVINSVPNSELVLKSISFHEKAEQIRVQEKFIKAGLNKEKLIILDWEEMSKDHMLRYSEIDIALDPIPYGGATTTAEALWMGVPVIAMAGKGMVGRLASSILNGAGLNEYVAYSIEEYVHKAKALASKGTRKIPSRESLRRQIVNSDFGNAKRLTTRLEEEYLRLAKKI